MRIHISTRQITYFLTLSEELNFGRSADKMNLSPSPFTRQIQMLEHALQARLFYRNNKSVALTREGEVFKPHAYKAIDIIDSAFQKIQLL